MIAQSSMLQTSNIDAKTRQFAKLTDLITYLLLHDLHDLHNLHDLHDLHDNTIYTIYTIYMIIKRRYNVRFMIIDHCSELNATN
jgi:hypothetical protein